MAIAVTELAAEEVRRRLEHENKPDWGLRVGVRGGGCSGLEYSLTFEEKSRDSDKIFEDKGVKLFCDPKSFLYVNGLTLDYSTKLIGGGFLFLNPNAKRSCSCGMSFST